MKFDKKETPQEVEPSGVIQRSPSQCSEDGESSPHIEDAVFGEVSEGGPNYRNVSQLGESITMADTKYLAFTGWMDRDGCPDDEDSGRSRSSLHPPDL